MKHEIFYGSHYQIGLQFGQKQTADGIFIFDRLPFPLTKTRRDFAAACLPIYQHFFPEILAEIAGLAAGQNCSAEDIQAILFSMYALPPAAQCSCMALTNPGQILLGRNSDFLTALADFNLNVIYHFPTDSDNSADFYGNTTAFIEMEDGVNAHGLALGLTSVAPTKIKPGFNAGLLLRYLLEKCQNTEQVMQKCQNLPIASAHTLIAADKQGNIALLEMCAQHMEIIRPRPNSPFVCAVNQFSSPSLQSCQNRQIDNWQAAERWQTLQKILPLASQQMDLRQVQELLSGQKGFLCQYGHQTGHDTVWSVIYDLSAGHIYRADDNPSRQPFQQDRSFSW